MIESDHTSNDKVKLFRKNVVVLGEGWFDYMNLTDGVTFPTDLIKRAKYRSNIYLPYDTN